jgi:hypothetical protein
LYYINNIVLKPLNLSKRTSKMIKNALFIFLGIVFMAYAGECDNPDSAWLLCEDFEYGDGDFDTWFDSSDFLGGAGSDDRGRVTLSSEHAHNGKYAVLMPAAPTSGYQGGSLDWRACEGEQRVGCSMRSFDQLYFRVWIRFAEDHRYVHHFLNVGGSQPDDYWYHGTAGCLPNGSLSMGTTVDFRKDSHESHFYTYFPEMECDPNCGNYMDVDQVCDDCEAKGLPTCDERKQCCWGNHFEPDPPVAFPVGEWFCFEMMMRANTVGNHDGSMAYWINDTLIHQEDGMMWRTSPTLAMNRMRLQHYITTEDAQGFSNRVWFDDVVVSTKKIGPGNTPINETFFQSKLRRTGVQIHRVSGDNILFKVVLGRSMAYTLEVYDLAGKKLWKQYQINGQKGVNLIEWNHHKIASNLIVVVLRFAETKHSRLFVVF